MRRVFFKISTTRSTLTAFFCLFCLILVVTGPVVGFCQSHDTEHIEDGLARESYLAEEVSRARRKHEVPSVQPRALLNRCARQYADKLAAGKMLSHLDEGGGRAVDRYRSLGGSALFVGEILAQAQVGSVENILEEWLHSPSHRKVILDQKWTHYGVGTTRHDDWIYAVFLFIHQPFTNVSIHNGNQGLRVKGIFNGDGDAVVCIYQGRNIKPENWDQDTGRFSFFIDDDAFVYYITLGYVINGKTVVTNTYLYEME